MLPFSDVTVGVEAYADDVEAKRGVGRDPAVVVSQPGEGERAKLALLSGSDREDRPLWTLEGAEPACLHLHEDERIGVERDQVELPADRRGPLVAGQDPHPGALELVGDEFLSGASQHLAGERHGGDRTGRTRARGAPNVKGGAPKPARLARPVRAS